MPLKVRHNGWLTTLTVFAGIVFGLPLLFYIVLRPLASVDFSWLWFSSVGYGRVFVDLSLVPFLVHVGLFLVTLLLFLRIGRKRYVFSHDLWSPIDSALHDSEDDSLHPLLGFLPKTLTWVYAIFAALITTSTFSYLVWLVGLHGSPFHYTDWLFHLNAAFYVFTLPVLNNAMSMLLNFAFFATIPAALDLLDAKAKGNSRALRIAISAFLFLLGVHEYISRYAMTYASQTTSSSSPSGQIIVAGADYYTVHWHLWVTMVTAVLFVAAALAVFSFRKRLSWPKVGYLSAGPIVVNILLGLLGALIVGLPLSRAQQTLEKPYMAHTIVATRAGFGISNVQVTPYPGNTVITAQDLQAARQTVSNIRLADPDAFTTVFSQLQSFRQYYTFPLNDVTVDRYYTRGGVPEEIMLDAREIDQQYAGSGTQQGLLQYTHGYGVIAAGVGSFTANGLPNLLLSNTPVQGTLPGAVTVKEPSIYYGENTDNPVIAPNALGEFDYPTSQASHMSAYAGPGINFDQNRLVIAMSQGLGYLFQGQVTAQSKFLVYRNVLTRVRKVAPWLALDQKPLLVVRQNGQLVWMVDGYTGSSNFPGSQSYSTPLGTANYLRNSVKVTVNAATGAMHFYAVGQDPIRDAWESVFPGMIQPLAQMPADIRAHIQYPLTLFNTQAEVLERYHIAPSNTDTFYAGNDNWSWPNEMYQNSGTPIQMPSEQIVAELPGDQHLQFMRVLPFVPPNRPNMVAWMAALEDGSQYGHIVLYGFPQGTLVPGPMQVESEISQNTTISADITLWDQHGSSVIRGDMLEIPIGGGMLAVEPLYVEASNNGMPELSDVIVGYNNQVAMGTNLGSALGTLFGQSVSIGQNGTSSSAGSRTPTTTANGGAATVTGIANQITQVNTQMMQAMHAGNLAQFGQDEQQLETLIGELQSALAE